MLVGGAAAYFRALPSKIYERILHLFSMTVVITDDSQAFIWYKWWFMGHKRSRKIRHVDVITPMGPEGRQTMLFPAPGSHWFWYKGRPFRMTFTRSEKDGGNLNRITRPETLTLRVVGRNQQFLQSFIKDVREKFNDSNQAIPKLYYWSTDYWDEAQLNLRPLESIILPLGLKEDLLDDIRSFEENRKWYDSVGMPFHRSYLLYGPPGTGKTSTLLGLASHLKKSIYLIKLAHITDDGLIAALKSVAKGSMVIFEDVDCLNNKRDGLGVKTNPKKTDKVSPINALTLSGLLNALDGIETPSDILFFLTTNVIGALDKALIRPGRVDRRIYLGAATGEQKTEMAHRFFPDWTPPQISKFIKDNMGAKTMAAFQEQLKIVKIKKENFVENQS